MSLADEGMGVRVCVWSGFKDEMRKAVSERVLGLQLDPQVGPIPF